MLVSTAFGGNPCIAFSEFTTGSWIVPGFNASFLRVIDRFGSTGPANPERGGSRKA